MASLCLASSVLSSFVAVAGVHAFSQDGLHCRSSNSVLSLKRSFPRVPLNCTGGKRAAPLRVLSELRQDQPKLMEGHGRVGPKPRVILIAGPTGVGRSSLSMELAKALLSRNPTSTRVGRSSLSMELAKALDGEIINADSQHAFQVPQNEACLEERLAIPHHLGAVVPHTRDYTQSEFMVAARTATEHILGKGKVPIVVGGTGMSLRMFMHNRADLTSQPFDGEFDGSPWDFDFQCYFLYQHCADLYPRVDLECEQMVPALLAEASWRLSQGESPFIHASARSPGYSEAVTLLLHARGNAGFVSEQQFLQFVFHFQEHCRGLVRQQKEWFRGENLSEVRHFKWVASDAGPVEKMVEGLAEEYRRAPGAVSRVSFGRDLRNASLMEYRRLREYMPSLQVFCDPAAVANTLDWIKATQGPGTMRLARATDMLDMLSNGLSLLVETENQSTKDAMKNIVT